MKIFIYFVLFVVIVIIILRILVKLSIRNESLIDNAMGALNMLNSCIKRIIGKIDTRC